MKDLYYVHIKINPSNMYIEKEQQNVFKTV